MRNLHEKLVDRVKLQSRKESDAVIFSLTRTTGSFRFLADARRLNVALSRARDMLYVVGNLEYARNNYVLRSIAEKCIISSSIGQSS